MFVLIIIEGVDRTGKTSLAKRIKDKVGSYGTVVHAGPPTKHPLEEYETALDGWTPYGIPLILDRWHIGEYVWPKIFGRESQFNTAVHRHVEMFMMSRGAFVVYAERDPAKIKVDLVEHDEPLDPANLDEALNLFRDALTYTGSHGSWDYERDGESKVENFIWNAEIRNNDIQTVWDVVGPGWVGNPRPKVLLVGDELGPEKRGRNAPDDIPFAPYDATSGRYLLDCIPDWKNTAIVNSLQGRNQVPRNLQRVWQIFGQPKVVALGKKAADALEGYDVPHKIVFHPQYWRRFRYHEPETYAKCIEEAARL